MPTNFLRVLPQYLVPQHALSRLVGLFTRSQNSWLKNWLIKRFIKHFNVDMSTAVETNPSAYLTFNQFFTRKLRAEVRPVVSGANSVACPVDGCISQIGNIEQGRIIQAKRFNYTVQQLLGGSAEKAAPFLTGL